MIQNKQDFRRYLEEDRKALRIDRKRPRIIGDEIWKYEILLRKSEYYLNCRPGPLGRAAALWYRYRTRALGRRLGGFCISPNCFAEGLSIAHWGAIVVHPAARIGRNCRIHEGVTIGATNGETAAAVIGDNVFLGSGAKVIGQVRLGDDIAVGANAVVTHDFCAGGITIGGVPAKKISEHSSHSNLSEFLDLER